MPSKLTTAGPAEQSGSGRAAHPWLSAPGPALGGSAPHRLCMKVAKGKGGVAQALSNGKGTRGRPAQTLAGSGSYHLLFQPGDDMYPPHKIKFRPTQSRVHPKAVFPTCYRHRHPPNSLGSKVPASSAKDRPASYPFLQGFPPGATAEYLPALATGSITLPGARCGRAGTQLGPLPGSEPQFPQLLPL